jgi:hypothetical protein
MPIVVKGDGTREEFHLDKLMGSLRHSGADSYLAEKIAKQVGAVIRDGMSTTEIYRSAFSLLRKEEKVTAARYSMRRAILELGPTGFPFEDYVSALMRAKGYEVKTRVVVPGRCIEHEVDVVMSKGDLQIGAELKFHNTPGFKTDVKTALYVRARYWDIQWGAEDRKEKAGIDEGWLITNTKFTENAINYAMCSGIKLLGWSFPRQESLADMIRATGVYPITVLTSLTRAEKLRLLASGVNLCHTVMSDPSALEKIGLSGKKVQAAVAESNAVCAV